ncbi:hypothetical protein RFI20_004700 [Klebsiella pneumoniae]|uniref:hypothetical protein n=1 Tax=Klebsiella/Raoultella group TaxID=2890311 RepID=UPI0004A03F22|nr:MULTISPECIES: hypothetical protein [Klebsiella]HBR1528427.1 hypothetical protein [Klebsiella quasipneumoniae subsp. quasipneumoniae]EIV2010467.1 hypothetical protein [Klebsiella pneumoniae]EIX9457240.1 hypothetical protein [Klebsiella pneumoniae]EIX9754613.1 hypothetical protein [Klebsiella pneumoniae]EKU6172682.1 hypothetical protein [Klebsiella pneumoniae]
MREFITVYLNGFKVKYAITVDDEKGEVIVAVRDSRGHIPAENGEVKRQTLYGTVR